MKLESKIPEIDDTETFEGPSKTRLDKSAISAEREAELTDLSDKALFQKRVESTADPNINIKALAEELNLDYEDFLAKAQEAEKCYSENRTDFSVPGHILFYHPPINAKDSLRKQGQASADFIIWNCNNFIKDLKNDKLIPTNHIATIRFLSVVRLEDDNYLLPLLNPEKKDELLRVTKKAQSTYNKRSIQLINNIKKRKKDNQTLIEAVESKEEDELSAIEKKFMAPFLIFFGKHKKILIILAIVSQLFY